MSKKVKINTLDNCKAHKGWRTLFLIATLLVSGQAYAAQSITFYHNDILGSPVATTDENGNICWREDYKPYGDKLKNNDAYEPSTAGCGLDDNQRGYTGHVFDKDIGLTYMQARYYDPVVGRFMGVDPVGVRLDNQVSFSRYAYGGNNPYRFTDPDGREIADNGKTFDQNEADERNSGDFYNREYENGNTGFSDDSMQDIFAELFGYNDGVDAYNRFLDGNVTEAFIAVALGICKPCKGAKGALSPEQAKNLARFNKKKPANSTDTVIRDLPGGGKSFQVDSAAQNIPGSFARFEKQIDSAGKTTQFTKTTFTPKGEIVHVKDKITGQTFISGQ